MVNPPTTALPALPSDDVDRDLNGPAALPVKYAEAEVEGSPRRVEPSGAPGLLVTKVTQGGPGDRLGIQVNDVLLRFDKDKAIVKRNRVIVSLPLAAQ